MSENNKAVLEAANAANAAGNYEGFLSFCTDDTKWTFVGDKTLNGKESVRQYMAETGAIFAACHSISRHCQARRHSATLSSSRLETPTFCCTGSLGDGENHSIDLAVLSSPHAHRAMGLFK